MKLRVLLVNYESPVLKELNYLSEHCGDVMDLGEASNALEALNLLRNTDNSLVFVTPPAKLVEVVPVEQNGKIVLLHQDEIFFIYTDKDKVLIKTQKDSYLTRFTLRELELRLNSTHFFRSHRCYIVNIQHMRELSPYFNGAYTIVVDDDERSEIPVSRTKSRILKEMLGL